MKYSIIIPTLNEEKLLPNLLNQICNEELKRKYDYEVIISDGGSTDNTINLALNRVEKITVHEKDFKQNIAEGRNEGAQKAEGNILIFLNGDIVFQNFNKFMEDVVKFSVSNKLAMTCSVMVEPKDEKLSDKIFLSFYNSYFHLLNIIVVGMGRGECHVIRKEVFERAGGYNQKLAAGEDFDLFKRIRKMGKIYFSKKSIIYESPRRYRKYGHFTIFFRWFFNSISVIFFRRSLDKEWEAVR